MPQNIGILLTKNERDVIEEVMEEHEKCFDTIFALDGSDDGTYEFLKSRKSIVFLIRDSEVSPDAPIRDGARQFLIETAQEKYGTKGWFSLLHGDEFFHNDPNQIASMADQEGIDILRWRMMNFFLHKSEEEAFEIREDRTKSIQERRRWYCPEWVEVRQFRNSKNVRFHLSRHGTLFPEGLNRHKVNIHLPLIKHYSYRTPEQVKARAKDRVTSGFGKHFEWVLNSSSVFRDKFENFEVTKCYTGSFEEYEFKKALLGNGYDLLIQEIKNRFPQLANLSDKEIEGFIEKTVKPKEKHKQQN